MKRSHHKLPLRQLSRCVASTVTRSPDPSIVLFDPDNIKCPQMNLFIEVDMKIYVIKCAMTSFQHGPLRSYKSMSHYHPPSSIIFVYISTWCRRRMHVNLCSKYPTHNGHVAVAAICKRSHHMFPQDAV